MRFPIDALMVKYYLYRLRDIFAHTVWKSPFSSSVFWL